MRWLRRGRLPRVVETAFVFLDQGELASFSALDLVAALLLHRYATYFLVA